MAQAQAQDADTRQQIADAVESAARAASDAAKVASNAVKTQNEEATKILNDFAEIDFVEIAMVLVAAWVIVAASKRVLPFIAERGPSQIRLYFLGSVPIVRLVVLVVATLWIIPIVFNITFQNFLVIAGAASVAIGFAFKDFVSSIIAGIVAVFERPYRPGDWVEIDGDYGEVRSVGLRAITVCTPDDDVITVPHEHLWKKNIANSNDGTHTLMCVADFYLAPDHDPGRIRAVLRTVALTSAYLSYDKPVIVVLAETPWGTHYKLKAYPYDMRDQFVFISDLTVRGKAALREAGGREVTATAAHGFDA